MPDYSFEENGKLFKPEGLPNGFCMTDDITKTSLVCIGNAAREKAPSSSARPAPLRRPLLTPQKLPAYTRKTSHAISVKRLEN